jgi:hypothetical protein
VGKARVRWGRVWCGVGIKSQVAGGEWEGGGGIL